MRVLLLLHVCQSVTGNHVDTYAYIYPTNHALSRTCAEPGLGHHDELAGLQRQILHLFCMCVHNQSRVCA